MENYRMAVPEERRAIGARINPETAEVWFAYGETLDPYGDDDLPDELQQTGREWFTCDPVERVSVHFSDLPVATREALAGKRAEEDRKGWEAIGNALKLSSAR